MMHKLVLSLLSATMLSGVGLCPAVSAAEADTADNAALNDANTTIIVTGLKPDEGQSQVSQGGALGAKTLLDTPYSISVIDAEDITRRQANSIGQIFANDPSVFSSAPSGSTNWWGTQIRGLGVRNYYIDDVPLLLYWGGDFPLEPIESVTALKGLTGFMYGFGAPGGVISYRTKRPTAEPMLTTEIGYRTNSVFYARADAGGPITKDGRLGYRVNIGGEKGNAYNQAGVNRLVGSLALEYAINPDLKWYATATYEDSNLQHEPFQFYWANYVGNALPRPTYDYEKLNVANSYYKARTLATATGLNWTFARGWSARLTYGYTNKYHRSNKMFVYMRNQAGDYDGYAYNFAELDQNHFVQAMIQGDVTTGPIRHQIVTGASFQQTDSAFGYNDKDYYWGNDFNGNIYQDQPFRVTRAIRFGTGGWPSKEQQRALFLSDTLRLGEHVQAMVGARYTRYSLADLDGNPSVDSGYRTSAVTPTMALIYKPAPYASLYGSYVEAMEPGSRVGGEYANAGEVLKATLSRQYEIGAKYEHRQISLTLAGFRIERANTIDRIINGARSLTQDGLTLYKGVEAIGSYRFSDRLKLGAGVLHLDPSIRNVSVGNEDVRGNIPAGAAKWQLTGNVEYYVPAVPGLSLHGNLRHTGKAPTSDSNNLYVPAYTTANLGFQYNTVVGGRKVTFTGNVNNLLNAKYWTQTNIGEGVNAAMSVRLSW
ncbi:TonB-dependent siderophore receptor [Novosphingobium sp. KACC 22771]|uniref:TonB-dependent siderophore receptor n=1 Tax=Novosphingobium sp. KACC 22771 TaxID=3025670 RepID=UPI0023651BFC|nr:TonB-dependent siderophore receptor [Novosphingobium sp. KACC 22771]WDF71344.1 TonB-dependent siderophore receptor [Novosphingobium sp. KACC 22771]